MKSAAEIRQQLGAARAALAAAAPEDRGDPAIARLNGAALKSVHKRTDAALARYVEAERHVRALELSLGRAEAREAEVSRQRPTLDEVMEANFVLDRHGWHEVIRVSTKSVTVKTPYSWTERIPIDKILRVGGLG